MRKKELIINKIKKLFVNKKLFFYLFFPLIVIGIIASVFYFAFILFVSIITSLFQFKIPFYYDVSDTYYSIPLKTIEYNNKKDGLTYLLYNQGGYRNNTNYNKKTELSLQTNIITNLKFYSEFKDNEFLEGFYLPYVILNNLKYIEIINGKTYLKKGVDINDITFEYDIDKQQFIKKGIYFKYGKMLNYELNKNNKIDLYFKLNGLTYDAYNLSYIKVPITINKIGIRIKKEKINNELRNKVVLYYESHDLTTDNIIKTISNKLSNSIQDEAYKILYTTILNRYSNLGMIIGLNSFYSNYKLNNKDGYDLFITNFGIVDKFKLNKYIKIQRGGIYDGYYFFNDNFKDVIIKAKQERDEILNYYKKKLSEENYNKIETLFNDLFNGGIELYKSVNKEHKTNLTYAGIIDLKINNNNNFSIDNPYYYIKDDNLIINLQLQLTSLSIYLKQQNIIDKDYNNVDIENKQNKKNNYNVNIKIDDYFNYFNKINYNNRYSKPILKEYKQSFKNNDITNGWLYYYLKNLGYINFLRNNNIHFIVNYKNGYYDIITDKKIDKEDLKEYYDNYWYFNENQIKALNDFLFVKKEGKVEGNKLVENFDNNLFDLYKYYINNKYDLKTEKLKFNNGSFLVNNIFLSPYQLKNKSLFITKMIDYFKSFFQDKDKAEIIKTFINNLTFYNGRYKLKNNIKVLKNGHRNELEYLFYFNNKNNFDFKLFDINNFNQNKLNLLKEQNKDVIVLPEDYKLIVDTITNNMLVKLGFNKDNYLITENDKIIKYNVCDYIKENNNKETNEDYNKCINYFTDYYNLTKSNNLKGYESFYKKYIKIIQITKGFSQKNGLFKYWKEVLNNPQLSNGKYPGQCVHRIVLSVNKKAVYGGNAINWCYKNYGNKAKVITNYNEALNSYRPGDIIVWDYIRNGKSNGIGHIAMITEKDKIGNPIIQEFNAGCDRSVWYNFIKNKFLNNGFDYHNYYVKGCIYYYRQRKLYGLNYSSNMPFKCIIKVNPEYKINLNKFYKIINQSKQ